MTIHLLSCAIALIVVSLIAIFGLWSRAYRRAATAQPSSRSLSRDLGDDPRAKEVYVYVAGCAGLKCLRERLGSEAGWWKVGVVGARGGNPVELLAYRMEMLAGYGAVVRTERGFVEEPGFIEWRTERLAAPASTLASDRVRLHPNFIAVRLPAGMGFGRFESQLRNEMASRSLHRHLGVGPLGIGSRYTISKGRRVRQTEICALRPRAPDDIAALLEIISTILDAHSSKPATTYRLHRSAADRSHALASCKTLRSKKYSRRARIGRMSQHARQTRI